MKQIRVNSIRVIQLASILMLLALAPPVMAECVQSVDFETGGVTDTTILAIDANNGCADIQGQVGCYIDGKDLDGGECTSEDKSFTVKSGFNLDGSLYWKRIAGTVGIDTHMVGGGAQGKNNCGYVHTYKVNSGSGGDCKVALDENGDCPGRFQNITGLHVCTDGKDEVIPPPPLKAEIFPHCEDDTGSTLDNTGITCPKVKSDGSVEKVIVCNFEKEKPDWGATDGSDLCCQCGYTKEEQEACVVTVDADPTNDCDLDDKPKTRLMSVDPTETVEIQLFRVDGDPCVWTKTRKGWKQVCS